MSGRSALPPPTLPVSGGADAHHAFGAPRLLPLEPGTVLDACEPIFAAMITLHDVASVIDPQTLYSTVADQLIAVRAAAKASGLNHDEVEAVAFALAAFADETVMSSEWAGRSQWPFLQYTEFRTHRAGEAFFEILERFRQTTPGLEIRPAGVSNGAATRGARGARGPHLRGDDPLAWSDPNRAAVLEVFYVCLMLGFRGKYAISEPEQYQQELARMRSHIQAKPVLPLGPVGFPPRYNARALHIRRWQWPAVGYLLLVVLLTTLILATHYIRQQAS